MDRLPLELVTLIYEHLEEFDLAAKPYSGFTEEPVAPVIPGSHGIQQHGKRNGYWVNMTSESCANILNARMASSVMYDGSHKSFARLLADRRFRFTNVGFENLILISRQKVLAPHIKTLTLGCASFCRSLGINETGFVYPCSFLPGMSLQDRARLATAYVACRDWQHDNMESHTRTLASILRAFPNLDSIRIVTADYVAHLGGWFKPEDENLVPKNHILDKYRTRLYNHESALMRDCIMEALELSRLTLRDFRADPRPASLDIFHTHLFSPALQTLRISLDEKDVLRLDSSQWLEMFGRATMLKDLSLQIDPPKGWDPYSQNVASRLDIAQQLFNALQHHNNLQRIELGNGLGFPEASLVSFIAAHSDSLRCLILKKPLLRGTWQSALKSIAISTYGKAEFVTIQSPAELNPVTTEVEHNPAINLELLAFSCPFVWDTEKQH
jgi:hypothetical protein